MKFAWLIVSVSGWLKWRVSLVHPQLSLIIQHSYSDLCISLWLSGLAFSFQTLNCLKTLRQKSKLEWRSSPPWNMMNRLAEPSWDISHDLWHIGMAAEVEIVKGCCKSVKLRWMYNNPLDKATVALQSWKTVNKWLSKIGHRILDRYLWKPIIRWVHWGGHTCWQDHCVFIMNKDRLQDR